VGFLRGAAGGVGHHVDFIVAFQHRAQREGGVAHFGPQAGDDDFFLAVGGQRVAHLLVVPRVHRGAFQDVLAREHVQQFRIGVARERLGLDGGDDGWNVEHLGGLGQANGIVLQHLAVHGLHTESHLRLLVDEDQLAVIGSQDF
jgi:hypothetical protein